uniref:Uncharacterized protein n=1 Tax=Xenopsylla cheopis TaxID=163159 RepID=A0A6M2DN64_XENCH
MASARDTATFFLQGDCKQFEHVLKLYPQALRLKAEKKTKKPEELIKLDNWYQNELPKKIKSRGKDAHLSHEELVQMMKWKQTRGKFYPQLSYLVKVNTPRAVMAETKKAFRKLPNLEQAITALSNLKGVGTTMASALLCAAAPETAPFMADECLMAIPEIEGIDYTTKEYLNFVSHIQATVNRLNGDEVKEEGTENGDAKEKYWSPHRVELALWTHYIVSDLRPELLDDVPGFPPMSKDKPLSHNGVNGNEIEPSDESNQEPVNGKVSADVMDDSTTSYTEDSLDKPPTPIVMGDETSDSANSLEPPASLKRPAPESTDDENSRSIAPPPHSTDSTVPPTCKKPRTSGSDIHHQQSETQQSCGPPEVTTQ